MPDYTEVSSSRDALRFAEKHGYPVVLKGEQGFAGSGVRVCNDPHEIETSLHELHSVPLLLPASAQQTPTVVAQQFIRGMPAMQVFCAMAGKKLEHMTALKQKRHPRPTSPSSVVRFLEHPEMDAAADTLLARLGFSGFASIDFMLEASSKRVYLIELNPRPCPISHLGHLVGRNLTHAFWCHITNHPYARASVANPPDCIALFPQEWLRDPQSPALTQMYHDVPWDDPALLRALMQ